MQANDIAAVSTVLGLYGQVMDRKEWERLPLVFTEDVVFDASNLGIPVQRGVADLIKMLSETPPPAVSHITANIVVSEEGGAVKADSKWMAPLDDGQLLTGVYQDVLVKTSDGWRISQRTILVRATSKDTA